MTNWKELTGSNQIQRIEKVEYAQKSWKTEWPKFIVRHCKLELAGWKVETSVTSVDVSQI